MTKFNQKNKSTSLSIIQSKAENGHGVNARGKAVANLRVDTDLLIKRVNALITHVSDLDGEIEAEKNSRETSGHLKNIKEIFSLNERIDKIHLPHEQGFTPEEEEALAAELAALIFRSGKFK
ncbi:MAG: hypothetical protein L3J05_03370 [Robiginitomaculum sp.]|nr:hypothetical protein [Robiginitomaculum sp.]